MLLMSGVASVRPGDIVRLRVRCPTDTSPSRRHASCKGTSLDMPLLALALAIGDTALAAEARVRGPNRIAPDGASFGRAWQIDQLTFLSSQGRGATR